MNIEPQIGMVVEILPFQGSEYLTEELQIGMVGFIRDTEGATMQLYFPPSGNPDNAGFWNTFIDNHEGIEVLFHGPSLPTAEDYYEALRANDP